MRHVYASMCPHTAMCPHTTTLVSSYYYTCVLILLYVLWYCWGGVWAELKQLLCECCRVLQSACLRSLAAPLLPLTHSNLCLMPLTHSALYLMPQSLGGSSSISFDDDALVWRGIYYETSVSILTKPMLTKPLSSTRCCLRARCWACNTAATQLQQNHPQKRLVAFSC